MIRGVAYGVIWVLVTLLFGLLPLWINYYHHMIHGNVMPWVDITKDGMILFFSMAIVSAVTFDYYLTGKRYHPLWEVFSCFVVPALIYILCIVTYYEIRDAAATELSYLNAFSAEKFAAFFACVYALINKILQFRVEPHN